MVDVVGISSLYGSAPGQQEAMQKQQYELQLQQLKQQLAQQVAAAKQQAQQQVQAHQSQLAQQLQSAQQQLETWKAQGQDTLSAQEQQAQQGQWAAQNPNAAQQQTAVQTPQWGAAPDFAPWALTNQRGQAMQFARGGMMPRFAGGGGFGAMPGDMGPGGKPRVLVETYPVNEVYSFAIYDNGQVDVINSATGTPVGTYGSVREAWFGIPAIPARPNDVSVATNGMPPSTTYGGSAYPSNVPAGPPANAPAVAGQAAAAIAANGMPPASRPGPPPLSQYNPATNTFNGQTPAGNAAVNPPAAAAPAAPRPGVPPVAPPVLSQQPAGQALVSGSGTARNPVSYSGSAVSRPALARPPAPNPGEAASSGVFDTSNVGTQPPGTTMTNGFAWGPAQQAALDAVMAQRAQEAAQAEAQRQAGFDTERQQNMAAHQAAVDALLRTQSGVSDSWNQFFAQNPGAAAALRGWGNGTMPTAPAALAPTSITAGNPNGWSNEFYAAVKAREKEAQDKETPGYRFARGGSMPPMPPASMMDEQEMPDDADMASEGSEPNAIVGEGSGPGGYNMEVVLTPEGLAAAKAVGGIKVVDKPTAGNLDPGSIIIPTKENSNLRSVLSKNIPPMDGEPAVKEGGDWTPQSMAKGGTIAKAKSTNMPPKPPEKLLKKGA